MVMQMNANQLTKIPVEKLSDTLRFLIAENETPLSDALKQVIDDVDAVCKKLLRDEQAPAQPVSEPYKSAANDIIAERQRQIIEEGWKPEHDDEHDKGELAMAAVCYINETGTVNRNGGKPWGWPWGASWWKPDTRRRNLVKASALILAEIERLDRAAPAQESE